MLCVLTVFGLVYGFILFSALQWEWQSCTACPLAHRAPAHRLSAAIPLHWSVLLLLDSVLIAETHRLCLFPRRQTFNLAVKNRLQYRIQQTNRRWAVVHISVQSPNPSENETLLNQKYAVSGYHWPVNQNIRVRGLPHQRSKLHDGDEAAKVLHFLSLIFTVHHTRQIEQLGSLKESNTCHGKTVFNRTVTLSKCTSFCFWAEMAFLSVKMWFCCVHLVHLCPEAMFEVLLGLPQCLVVPEWIQVSQHTHDSREAVYLADVEELKSLHLKAKAGIN